MGACHGKDPFRTYRAEKKRVLTSKTWRCSPCTGPRYRPDNRPTLTEEEQRIVSDTWNVIMQDVERVGVVAFTRLFETHPDVQEVFLPFRGLKLDELRESILLKTHVLKVMGIVEKCMARIDKPKKMETMLHELGYRHAGYKAKPEHLDMIIPQFVKAVIPSMGDRWTPEVESAWDHFFQYILHIVKEGMVL